MSGFALSSEQRRGLLAGSLEPLDFDDKPGFEPGARYVLAWAPGQPAWVDGYGIRALRVPVWYITVSGVQRHRKGFWRVRFDASPAPEGDE